MQQRDYIDSTLYLLGEELYEGEVSIKLTQPRYGRMLRFLFEHPDTVLSIRELYRNGIRESNVEVDYDKQVGDVMKALGRANEKLKNYIRESKTQKGYMFCPPLRLKPDRPVVRTQMHLERRDLLKALEMQAFRTEKCFLLYGPPGMGKTELVRDFTRHCAGKRFRHIFTVRYEESLRRTVTTIRTEGNTNTVPRYEDFLDNLKVLGKHGEILLIVDNLDITPEKFEQDQETLEELLELELCVFFISRSSLAAWFGGNSMELTPMDRGQLRTLFHGISRERYTQEAARADRLIQIGLQDNTYLTVLTATLLLQLGNFDVLENALLTEGVGTLRETVSAKKDEKIRNGTLMDHFKTLYTLGNLNQQQKSLLLALCLIPAGGMDRRLFLERVGGTGEERNRMERVMAELEKSFWVIRTGDEVSLHPMVRELVLEEPIVGRPLRNYVEATAQALYSREYEKRLLPQLYLADVAWSVIKKQKLEIPETAFLVAQIASTWDTLTDYKASFIGSKQALPLLDRVQRQFRDADGLYWLALCYNVTGFALNHTKTDEAAILAEKALQMAEDLVEQGLAHPSLTEKSEEDLLVLRTKVHSNMAARSINIGAYEEALRFHQAVLAEREELWQRTGKEEFRKLMATSCKNIGTVKFYLSKQELMDSWKNHDLAMAIYAEESTQSEAYFVALHRSIGSLLRLIEMSNDKEIAKLRFCTREELLVYLLRRQRDALRYLIAELPLAGEIRNGYENTCRILYHAAQKGICSGDLQDIADQIWILQYRLPEHLGPELQEKIKKVIRPMLLLLDKLR